KLAALSRLARTGADDHWSSLAILTGVGPGPWRLWKILVETYPDWFSAPDAEHAWFIEKLAMLAAASRDENDLRESAVSLAQDKLPLYAKMVLLSSLAGKLPAPTSDRAGQNVLGIIAEAERAALAPERPLAVRLAAVRLLGRWVSPGVQTLARLLLPGNPPEIQSGEQDRKSTRLNSSHRTISYA